MWQQRPSSIQLSEGHWRARHRLLVALVVGCAGLLVPYAALVSPQALPLTLVLAVVSVLLAVPVAVLPGRAMPAAVVALGLVAVSAVLVAASNGATEAHFAFFVLVGALLLYRSWLPLTVFLVATLLHHLVLGTLFPELVFDDGGHHAVRWALVHGVAVLLAVLMQAVVWWTTEVEEARALADLSQTQAQYAAAFDRSPSPIMLLTPDGHVVRMNQACRQWLALPVTDEPGLHVSQLPLLPLTDEGGLWQLVSAVSGDELAAAGSFLHEDGRRLRVEVRATVLRDRDEQARLLVTHCTDVTERHEHHQELLRRAREDALTGLLNRRAFDQALRETLGTQPAVLIYADVDRLKAINDSHGHAVGDLVLCEMARRLKDLASRQPGMLVARIAGDEFLLGMPGTREQGQQVAQDLLAVAQQPVDTPVGALSVTVSIGVAQALEAGQVDAAVLTADTAMSAAKATGRDQVKVFDDSLREQTEVRLGAEAALRAALTDDPQRLLPVWFQPIVATRSGAIVGAESLLRLVGTDGKVISPGVFIPVAEETGLIVAVGEHVLRTALRQLVTWGDQIGYVSVNVSPQQLADTGFVPMLQRALQDSGLQQPAKLVLEITETSLLTPGVDLTARLAAIKELGVRLALDDFGTGYSSLTWLKQVPADIVKLDRSFVAGLSSDHDKSSIIFAILWMARSLRMSVVAEGVEEIADWLALEGAGCGAVQGFLFSKPVPVEAMTAMLADPPPSPTAARRSARKEDEPTAAADDSSLPRQRLQEADQATPGA